MLKKKVVVKSKKNPEISQHQRGSGSGKQFHTQSLSKLSKADNRQPIKARTYSLNKPTESPKTYIVNNMIKLCININDVKRLEKQLTGNNGLLSDIDKPNIPVAWNGSTEHNQFKINTKTNTSVNLKEGKKDPFKSLIKRTNTNIKTDETDSKANTPNVKDLIINSGVKRQSKPILDVYTHGWPAHSPYACWYCCHTFNTTPVGIPQMLVNMTFYCYGNFCSYNCGKRYLMPKTEDDMSMLQTCNDTFIKDDLGEQIQLLELLCHIETGTPLHTSIKPASSRLTLTMFGGNLTIDDFRNNFKNNDNYHVFKSPLVPISYQMEEANDKIERKRRQRVSIDTVKIERAFNELSEKAKKTKGGALSKKRITKDSRLNAQY